MATTRYGFNPRKLGYGYQQPPSQTLSPRALAAGAKTPKQEDPFGLTTGQAGANGYFNVNPLHAASPAKTVVPATTSAGAVAPQSPPQTAPPVTGAATTGGAVYDLNTDVALQQANAYIGLNDQQAQAEALKAKQQELLAYGDPALVAKLFGQNDPFVQAAGQNPTSTLKQLGQQHDRGLTDMTDQFNKSNLIYSGARVKGEQNFAQDYQNALAQAASGVNQNLGGIDNNLSAALSANNMQRIQALQDAYARHLNDPGVDPGAAAGATAGNTTGALPGGSPNFLDGSDPNAYRLALALAGRTRRPVGVL